MTHKFLEKHLHMYKNAHCSTAGNYNGKKHVHSMECYSWSTQPYTDLKDMQFVWFGESQIAEVIYDTICVKAYIVILDIF